MEASSGSSRPINREDRRLALTERFWDLLAMVLLEKVWETCMFTSLPPLPGAPICCRQITLQLDSSHRICKTITGQKPGPGFFLGRRALRRSSQWCLEKCWATDKRMEQWREREFSPPQKEAWLPFCRPFSLTAIVGSGVTTAVEASLKDGFGNAGVDGGVLAVVVKWPSCPSTGQF